MTATVAVIGGGFGGITVAKALDDVADVVLIEPRDTFFYNVAALRGVVDLQWVDRIFLPYDRLLARGQVVRDRAVRVTSTGLIVRSGNRIAADFIVLATGSAYPFPAKIDIEDATVARAKIRATHEALAEAGRIVLLGAGAVGLEFAGEIKSTWPEKSVTIVDPSDDVLSGAFPDEFRIELRRQLDALGVEVLLGTSLLEQPPSDPGVAKTFTATTRAGTQVPTDIWFRCFGLAPVTDYLAAELSDARRPTGFLDVTADLRLAGQSSVFAIGDITALPEAKTAKVAGQHAEVVAANIRSLIRGNEDLVGYEPSPPGISLPLGPMGGASYAPDRGVLDAETTSRLKGADLKVDNYLELMGLTRR
jgi:apoptosis-inducing factor 2